MNRRDFRIGPGAASLMLVVVVLSMSVLGMLALMNARGDAQLSRRSAVVAEETARLYTAAQRSLAARDAAAAQCSTDAADDADYLAALADALPLGMTLAQRDVTWQEQGEDARCLRCTAQLSPLGAFPRCRLTAHVLVTQLDGDEEMEWDDAWN